jgi:hypothetical protein
VSHITALARKPLSLETSSASPADASADAPAPPAKLHALIEPDSAQWAARLEADAAAAAAAAEPGALQPPRILFSALGTTRAQAGGLANQRAIELDLNMAVARAAHAAGARVFVLVSAAGASRTSLFPYTRLKGEIEDAAAALGFRRVVLLRPGLIVGARRESRPVEAAMRSVATWAGRLSGGGGSGGGGALKDFWAQDADVIARAAVRAGLQCLEEVEKEEREGKAAAVEGGTETKTEGKVWVLQQADIIRLGRQP